MPDKRNEVEKYFLKAIDIIEKSTKDDSYTQEISLAPLYNNLGFYYLKQGQNKKAEEFYLKAINIYETLLEKDSPIRTPELLLNLAMSYDKIYVLYDRQNQVKIAHDFNLKAIALYEELENLSV